MERTPVTGLTEALSASELPWVLRTWRNEPTEVLGARFREDQVGRLPSNLKPIQLEIPLGFSMEIEEIQGFCTEIQGFCAFGRV